MAPIQHFDENPHRPSDRFADERIKKERAGVFGFFVDRYRLTFLLLVAVVIGGALALTQIPRESDPEVKIPIAVVTTVFPGASPSDVEDLITDEVESRVEELSDVKLVTSQSRLGVSSLTVEFRAEADLEQSISDLKDKVNSIVGLPDEAEDPIVTEISANDFPIIGYSIAGDLTQQQLKQLGETIQDELESIPNVSNVPLLGSLRREYTVTVNRGALERLSLPIGAIINAIRFANADTPLGSITIDNVNYNVRTVSKFTSVDDLSKVVVSTTQEGTPILLSDVADVEDGFAERNTISRISIDGKPAVNTVSLQIFKNTGGNILEIVDESKVRIDELKDAGVIPEMVDVEVSTDYSQFIRKDLQTLGTSGLQATILIFFVMLIALSLKEAIISVLAIPLTFLMTFIVLNAQGFTLNSLSLFSLVLSLGLLVDTFIVILEGIFHNMRAGYGARESALLSVATYKKPLFAGIFTTISAFVPMLLVSGILGEYLKVLPITISIVLLSALLISFVFVPSMAAVFMRRRTHTEKKQESLLERYLTNWLRKKYRESVTRFLRSRKKKVVFSGIMTLLFITSLGLLISGIIPVKLFPNVDVDFGYIDIEMPIGTDLEQTETVVRQVEEYLYGRDDIESFVTTIGRASSFGFGESSQTREHLANINYNLPELDQRHKKSFVIGEEIREDLKSIREGRITVREIAGGPPTGAPIEARITGDDLTELSHLSQTVVTILEGLDGTLDVESDEEVSPADLTFRLNKEALARSGLSIGEVSSFLRTAIFGVTATEVTVDGEDVDVNVELSDNVVSSVEEIQNLSIINNRGESVKLARVADFSLEPALAIIRHRDFERSIVVRANLEPGFAPGPVVAEAQKKLELVTIPKGHQISFGGEVEDIEQSFSELWSAMIVAIILITVILVLQFDSFIKPFVILFAFPLIVVGVTIGMLLLRLPFSFSVFLGIVALAGIAVNDAIVLLDKAGRNMKERNMPPAKAIEDAGDSRLQPILLTSITTIIGVVPLAFADEFWLGLSVAVAFGLAFATIMQLYVIPMLFVKLIGRGWKREHGLPVTRKEKKAYKQKLALDT